jgi:predicted O-linked N-acetylglucosamine transferase (SPINDLY family)
LSKKTNQSHRSESPDAGTLLAKARELIDNEQWHSAALTLQEAAEANPDDADILRTLAQVQIRKGQYIPALRTFDHLIGSGQAEAADYSATGDALTDVGEYAQAVETYRHSIDLLSINPEAFHNLARVLYRLGKTDEAAHHLVQCTKQCDQIDPWLSLATILPGCCHTDQQKILDVRQHFAVRLAENETAVCINRVRRPTRQGISKLRVGYLSAFFHCENYMKPVWGLINSHNRHEFKIHLFSDSPMGNAWPGYRHDPEDRVHEIATLDNAALGDLIQSQEIDILVDLNAYSTPHRLGLFLGHPAPITMAWFNMYATSGLPGIDYIVGDPWVVRSDEAPYYSEEIATLPLSYLSFAVYHDAPEVVAPPCTRAGELTFGSLVSQYKITPEVMDAWAEILKRTDNTRLFLANNTLKSKWNCQYVIDQFHQRKVDPERLTLSGPRDHFSFLQYYDQIDIALDAFPYNGGTTTMEALWQGVPVLTQNGDRWASRTSNSLLANSPVKNFVAADCRKMIEQAVAMAEDAATPDRLVELRLEMRDRLAVSPVCDTAALCRHMEALYGKVYADRRQYN